MGSYPEKKSLISPVWKTGDKEFWYLRAYNSDLDFKFRLLDLLKCANFYLLYLEMFIITSFGEVPMKSESNQVFSIEKSLIVNSDKKSIFHSHSMLSVGCRIRGRTTGTRKFCMYSVLHNKKFQWTIRNFDDSIARYVTCKETGNLLFLLILERSGEGKLYTIQVMGIPSFDGWSTFFDWKLSLRDNKGSVLPENFLTLPIPIWKWNISLDALNEHENLQMEFETIVGVQRVSGSSLQSSLGDDLLHMYQNNTLSDATLNAEGKSFSSHRSILAARSSVFRAMFEKEEMTESRSGVVDIEDVDDETMDRMLVFLYSDSLEGVQWAEASKLYYAADKYDVQSLKLRCCYILIDGLTLNNACGALVLADRHSDDDLMTSTVDFIGKHAEVISSKTWDEMEETNPRIAAKVTRA